MPDVLTSVDHIMHEIYYHEAVAQKYHVILEIGPASTMTYESMLMSVNEVDAKEHLDDILITNEK